MNIMILSSWLGMANLTQQISLIEQNQTFPSAEFRTSGTNNQPLCLLLLNPSI